VGVHLLVEAGRPPVAHALVQGPCGGHEPGGVEGEDRRARLAGALLQLAQERGGDAVAAVARVHGESAAARPPGRPARALGGGIGVERRVADDFPVDEGDAQLAVTGVPVEVEQVGAVAVPHGGVDVGGIGGVGDVEQRADRGVVCGPGGPDKRGRHVEVSDR